MYDLTNITDQEIPKDENLLSFIIRFAVGEFDEKIPKMAAKDDRVACISDTLSMSKAPGPWRPFSPKDSVDLIRDVLSIYSGPLSFGPDPVLWNSVQEGRLESVRELIAKTQSSLSENSENHVGHEIDISNMRKIDGQPLVARDNHIQYTIALYRDLPVWIDWSIVDDLKMGLSVG